MAIDSNEPLSETGDLSLDTADAAVSAEEATHADPITGEPGAHPTAVGVGAIAAGAAGAAAIGAFAGPIGALIGAAIGAVAGGLAGHEVAASHDDTNEVPTGDLNPEANGSTTDESGRPSSVTASPEEDITIFPGLDLGSPAVTTLATPTALAGDAFAPEPETAAHVAAVPVAATRSATPAMPVETGEPLTAEEPLMADEAQDFAPGGKYAGTPVAGANPLETVRVAAYYRYKGRQMSGLPEDDLADWYDAEQEVHRA